MFLAVPPLGLARRQVHVGRWSCPLAASSRCSPPLSTELMPLIRNRLRSHVLPAAVLSTLLLAGCADHSPTLVERPQLLSTASTSGVVISQVYGGGGNLGATLKNDFIELYNAGAATVPLDGWSVQYASAGGTSWAVTPLSGSMLPGTHYLVQQAAGNGGTVDLPFPDATGGITMAAGAGKVALVSSTTPLGGACPASLVVDFVGYGSTATCYEGSGPTATLTNTTAALRRSDGAQDTDVNANDFVTGAPNPRNSSAGKPTVTSISPTSNGTNVAVVANVRVTFSQPVSVSGEWYSISCTTSGAHTATMKAGSGPTTYTLDPDANFELGETCTATVVASKVADQARPLLTMAADYVWSFTVATTNVCAEEYEYTPAFAIQGSGLKTPLPAQSVVTTRGVVVGDYEGAAPTLRGFYLQDLKGDGDLATSDAVFVFNANNDDVALGDVVSVTGTAEEFQDQTQLSNVSSVVVCGSGASVDPVNVTLPVESTTSLERYEGMLVRFPQKLYVTEHFQLGRFGQVVMSAGGRLPQPTSIAPPGGPALAVQSANNLNRIIVDDALNNQNADPILFGRLGNPLSAGNTLRGGDAATGIVGVLTYTWAGNAASGNAYRVRPVNALGGAVPAFAAENARPGAPTPVGGTLKVAAANLLNYFNTFGTSSCSFGVGGGSTECRGASNAAEFDRQWPKTVAALTTLDADVLGVNEIENDGYGPQSAIADLVQKLNAATAPGTYAFIDVDAATGQTNALGTDAIKVGLIYKPARVTPVGTTTALNSTAFVNGGEGSPRNRATVAQAFEQPSGARFVVTPNHLKSKGSPCTAPDAGDGQGNCNLVREEAAKQLASWLASDPTGTGDPDVLIVGDLNSYAKEDPVTALVEAGYENLIASKLGPNAYSYAFDGQWGYLDHALASSSLAWQVSGVGEWHINADEPSVLDYLEDFKSNAQKVSLYAPDQYRVADHDPVIVGLNLPTPYPFGGFLRPVANSPVLNKAKAGTVIPVKFSLGGNRGLNIFQAGFPASRPIACPKSGTASNTVDETATAGQSGLSYDAKTDSYTYVWRTEKGWAGTCRELVLRLNDGTQKTARFSLTR